MPWWQRRAAQNPRITGPLQFPQVKEGWDLYMLMLLPKQMDDTQTQAWFGSLRWLQLPDHDCHVSGTSESRCITRKFSSVSYLQPNDVTGFFVDSQNHTVNCNSQGWNSSFINSFAGWASWTSLWTIDYSGQHAQRHLWEVCVCAETNARYCCVCVCSLLLVDSWLTSDET